MSQCEWRYPVPQTSPPREEGEQMTYRCGLRKGHKGAHGPIGGLVEPAHPESPMTEWQGWALIKGDELCYIKQDHLWPEVAEFSARQEYQLYVSRGENVRLVRVRFTSDAPRI